MKSLNPIESYELEDTQALLPSDTIYSGALAASTQQIVAVPAGADFVIFTATNDIYVNYDTTATVPTGSISQAGGELNPIIRYVGETTNLHIISPYVCLITLSFYSK